MRMVIVLSGGVIQDIFANGEKVRVLVCDLDSHEVERAGPGMMETPGGDTAIHTEWEPQIEPGLVHSWFARKKKHDLEVAADRDIHDD